MAELGVAWISVLPDTSKLAPQIRRAFDDAQGSGKRSGGMLGGAFASAAKKTIAGAGIATAAAGALTIKGGLNRLLQIDDARARLKGLGLSLQEIGGVQANVDKAVTGTAFSLAEGMTAATTAMSSGVQQGKDLERYLTLIGDVATQGGAEYGEMADIINQVQARGKVGQENLNRLTERGIGIQSMMAEYYGVSGEALAEMLRKGQVSAADFQKVLENNFAGSAQKAGDTVRGSFANMRTAFSRLGASMMEPIFEKMPGVFMGIRDTINQAQPAAAAFGQAVGEIASRYGPPLIDGLVSAAKLIGSTVALAWRMRGVIAAVGAAWLAWRVGILVTTAAGWASYLWKSKDVIKTALQIALTKKLALAQLTLNKAMKANPIGVVLVALTALAAGAVWAFKNVGWFRDGVLKAWSWIKSASATAWSFLKGVFSAVVDWTGGWLPQAFGFLKSIVGTYLKVIGTYFRTWWAVAKLVFQLAVAFVRFVLAPIFTWLWSSIIKPVFGFIAALIRTWWAGLKIIFAAVKWYISNVLAPIFSWLWKNVIGPVFGWIGERISRVWNGVIKPVFAVFRSGVGKIADAFAATRRGIARAWDKLGDVVSKPINKAKEIINGFLSAIDSIPGVDLSFRIGGGKAPDRGGSRGGRHRGQTAFATGGAVFGPGSGTSDSIMARLSNGEHVLTAQDVRNLGGQAKVYALRAAAAAGQFHMPGFAKGGAVISAPLSNPHPKSQYPWATFAGDFAAPVGTPIRAWKDGVVAAVRSLTTSYGKHMRFNNADGTSWLVAHLSRFAAAVGDRVKQGQVVAYSGNTGNSTGPHAHVEFMGGLYRGAKGAAASVWDTLKGAGGRIGDWIKSKLLDKANIGGLFGNVSGLFRSIGNGVKGYVTDKLFDSGGLTAGKGLMVKNTLSPERVLSPRQTAAFESALSRGFGPGGGRGGRVAMTITNWDEGTGYFIELAEDAAEDVVDNAGAFADQMDGMVRA